MSFQDFHRYQRAVDEGLVEQLSCPNDGERMYTMAWDTSQEEWEPALYCWTCETKIKPGLHILEQVQKANESLPT